MRQSFTGNALEAIRGLGVSPPEYEEGKKNLQTKSGGTRRLLRAYMDRLGKLPTIRINDVQALEKFADLVRITVKKLQAEGRDGELGDGTLQSLLVKNLSERQLENYSRWSSEHVEEKTVTTFKDWLQEEARFRVEEGEMATRIESRTAENVTTSRTSEYPHSGRGRNFHILTNGMNQGTQSYPVVFVRVMTMVCGSAGSFITSALTTVGRSLKKRSFVFVVWPPITKERIVEDLKCAE